MRNLDKYQIISYAQSFISHLFRIPNIKDHGIRSIYLFGSVARGDFDKSSDVDMFIDSSSGKMEFFIEKALKSFYKSEDRKKFELMGINNEIKVMHGNLEEWQLKQSVESNGILIYSQSVSHGLGSYFIVKINPIKDIAKRNKVLRKLSGRNEKHYKDKGIVIELGGKIIDNRVFIVPSDNINDILKIFSEEKVDYSIEKIWKK